MQVRFLTNPISKAWILAVFIVGWLPTVATATVLSVSMADVLDRSEFIFEGQVVSVNPNANPGERMPRTCVTFQVIEIIKGHHAGSTVDLCFLGGQSGAFTMKIPEIEYPQINERGIYFVETTGQRRMNPFVGWEQGHFLIEPQGGKNRVTTAGGQPVMEVSLPASAKEGISKGAAQGIRTAGRGEMDKAITVADFKSRIRTLLGGPR